jgi:hypothetical protein
VTQSPIGQSCTLPPSTNTQRAAAASTLKPNVIRPPVDGLQTHGQTSTSLLQPITNSQSRPLSQSHLPNLVQNQSPSVTAGHSLTSLITSFVPTSLPSQSQSWPSSAGVINHKQSSPAAVTAPTPSTFGNRVQPQAFPSTRTQQTIPFTRSMASPITARSGIVNNPSTVSIPQNSLHSQRHPSTAVVQEQSKLLPPSASSGFSTGPAGVKRKLEEVECANK